MRSLNPLVLWRRFLGLGNESPTKTLIFAFLLALTVSAVVSVSAVMLRPYYLANLELEKQEQLEKITQSLPDMADLLSEAGVDKLEVRIINLDSGQIDHSIDPETFDQRKAARDPVFSTEIPPELDVAGLGQRSKFAAVYLLRKNRDLKLVVLPVRGVGYQSMLYAFLALHPDGVTISGLSFYEQGETPGMGAKILDADWQASWSGKKITNNNGAVLISVVRGQASGPYEVDGISGATLTGNGVSNMLKFWLGENGFGPFLTRLRAGEF